MRTSLPSILTAAALLGWGLLSDATGQGGTWTPGTDLSRSSGQPSGTAGTPGARPGSPGAAATTPGSGAGTPVSEQQLDAYVQARRQIESQYPELRQVLESGDLAGQRDRLAPIFSGGPMSTDEFIQVHRMVQSDPQLAARVQARLQAPASGTGTRTPGGQTQPGWRGGPTDIPPAGGPTTSGPTGGAGAPAAPGARPGPTPR